MIGPALQSTTVVQSPGDDLVSYLAALRDGWRGWQGVREFSGSIAAGWGLIQQTLAISATNDGRGHIHLLTKMGVVEGLGDLAEPLPEQPGAWVATMVIPLEVGTLDRIVPAALAWSRSPG